MTSFRQSASRAARRIGPVGRVLALLSAVALAFAAGTCIGGSEERTASRHAGHGKALDEKADVEVWTCSMHPQVRRSEPGKCPICGMDLIPADTGGDREEQTDPRRITLSERAKTLARIRTTAVRYAESAGTERRLLGRIDYDETTLQTVTAWTGGRIDRLHVSVTGQRVRKGQVIATLYSPEIYSAHQDLLAARAHRRKLAGGSAMGSRTAGTALEAARRRLELLGVPDREIDRMAESEQPWRQVPIRSPFSGTIIERLATEGSYVETGSGLYELAGLRRLWVQLDAYESDLPLLDKGQHVDIEAEALPGETLEGRVAFIDPVVDPKTRTAKVRIEIPNPDRKLRPGMFAEAIVHTGLEDAADRRLVIPEAAPLFTGQRSVVYVEVPDAERPTYEMRVVKLGPKRDGLYPVLAGLQQGERVVTHGAFVLDADLQIRGGISMMSVPDDTERGPYGTIVPLSGARRRELADVVGAYLKMQQALADDDLEGARKAARQLERARNEVGRIANEHGRTRWQRLSGKLASHASHVSNATSLGDARSAFRNYSHQLKNLLRWFGNPLDEPLYVARCPMAFGSDRGAEWVQRGKTIDNSYRGAEMRTCGSIETSVGPGSHLEASEMSGAEPAGGAHQH